MLLKDAIYIYVPDSYEQIILRWVTLLLLVLLLSHGCLEVTLYHIPYQLFERNLGSPSQESLGLCWVTKQGIDFCWAEVSWIDLDNGFSSLLINSFLIHTGAFPADFDAELLAGKVDKFTNTVLLSSCNHIILWFILLEHEPLHLDVILRMPPISLRVEISQVQCVIQTSLDPRQTSCDLPCHKCLTSQRGLVVEQDTIAGKHTI
mmetsp:Transcript_40/g.69  ORF Transcript_40/g.69 Transcript_40/m.69 type:complete len:205 (-) Transcript_40:453-1067(-)